MFFRSIRFRLTLWYVLTLAVILAASGFFWQLYLSRNMLSHIDDRLLLVAQDVGSFHALHHEEPPSAVQCQALEDFIRLHNWGEYVQILSDRGDVTCTSSNLKGFHLPLSKSSLQHAANHKLWYETVHIHDKHAIRLLTFPLLQQGKVTDLVQVGQSLSAMDETLEELGLILLTFSPLALLLISLGGWFLAGRTLAPMVRITRAVRKINAENLNQRLPVGNIQDEIATLVETFNSMLARLEDSFRKIRQFSADASHELRTPLTILRGETEVALRWAKKPEEFRNMLESNMEEIDRMGRIIENLLTLSKSDAGELPPEVKELSLSDLLQGLYLQAKTLGEAKNITIALRLDVSEEIHIRGDELRLRQMFLNLISNGIKYTPPGGRLEIAGLFHRVLLSWR
ncbi:MAG: histidine kinase dimerization/phospho-acceptor domain-containing protein [Desulfuromonadales bacterium]